MADNNSIKLEISDILGFIDLNGEDALDLESIEKLEGYIEKCNEAMDNMPIVEDAVYDRMKYILSKVKPDSALLSEIWGQAEVDESEYGDEDIYTYLKQYPMWSIQTIKDFDVPELAKFINALPEEDISLHYSLKENGHGIRLVFRNGELISATSRARHGAGKDLTTQMRSILGERMESLKEVPLCEVRGELLLPFANLDAARQFNPEIKTAFSGVSSMIKASGTPEMWGLLSFVAYRFISEGYGFDTKEEEYEFLEDVGFEIPMYWVQEEVNKHNALDCIKSMLQDCEEDVQEYSYFTDGVVCEVNDRALFSQLGIGDNNCNVGNIALKVGLWKQDLYSGIVQTILWTQGKKKLSPVAIIAEEPEMIEYSDEFEEAPSYITDLKDISNMQELGILTGSGNKVRRVPLYEPSNIWALGAFKGETLFFRFGGEAGVVPCFANGKPLVEGRVEQILEDDYYGQYSEEDWEYI